MRPFYILSFEKNPIMLKNTPQAFGFVSKFLHWVMALLLTGLFSIGLYMTGLDYYDPLYHSLPWWHKSVGLLVLFLLIIRFIWKLLNIEPQPLGNHKPWEINLAHLTQHLFYWLILIIALSGYFIATAEGKGVDFFNGFELPAMISEIDEDTADFLGEAHQYLSYLLAGLVIVHSLGALKHHFIDKDETLKRML